MKKFLISILVLLILVGCKPTEKQTLNEEEILEEYLEKLENYQVRKKNIDNNFDNKEFDEYLDEIFRYYISLDFLSMHFGVIDYRKYDIEKPEVSLGNVTYGFDEETYNKTLEQLDELQNFDFASLSYRQQYDYEALEYSLIETIIDICVSKYNKHFDSNNNAVETIVDNLINYTFYDQESVDDYMVLIQDVDRYLDDCMQVTKQQAKDGINLLDNSIDRVTDYAQSLVDSKNNTLIDSFEKRIKGVDFLNDKQIEEYSKQNKECVNNEILPAVKKVIKEVSKYRGKTSYEKAKLINISKNYAKAKYYLAFSDNKPIEEKFNQLLENFRFLEKEFVYALSDSKKKEIVLDIIDNPSGCLSLDAVDTLEYLKKHSTMFYPDLGDASYNVDFLSADTGSTSTKAYYFEAPIDNYNQNIIKVNPNSIDPGTDTFETLAHEGFPGHLYQSVYSLKHKQHNFRRVIGFIGQTEGYAVCAQNDCLKMLGINDEQIANALFFYDCDYFDMYSLIDIAVNYFDYSISDVVKLFMSNDNFGIYNINEDSIESLINYLIDMPALYCSYGMGYTGMMNLRNKAKTALGDKFDLVEFNSYVLKNGNLPFNLLDECINEYIDKYK